MKGSMPWFYRLSIVAVLLLCSPQVHAASSSTTTRKLIDTPLASVINTGGAVKLIRISDNSWAATGNASCPDGVTFPNAYAKCFSSAAAYSQQCTGSNYCGSNTSWDGNSSKCAGTTATSISCGTNTRLDSNTCYPNSSTCSSGTM